MLISMLSDGAITLSDTSNIPVNDRQIILKTLLKLEETKKKRREEAKTQREANKRRRSF